MATYDDELLTYREAGQRLGVRPDSVMRRARRQGWERVEGNKKTDPVRIRVPAAVLTEPRTSPLDRARRTPRISVDAVAMLGAALERQEMANKVLQATLDAARAEIALAQIYTGKAETLRLAAEKGADDLARRLESAEAELSAAEAHAAELQAKAETLRLAAEKGTDDLARRLEREEMERRTLQDQTDAVRVELSAAEAHAAELQAKFDALEMKRQAALPEREHTLWQQHAAHRIRELERQLEVAKVAAGGRDEFGAPSRRKRWWWPFQPILRG